MWDLRSPTRDQTHTHCIGKRNINHWTAREVPQHPFVIKPLSKLGVDGSYLNIIKAVYEKLTVNIILIGERLQAFPLRSGTTHLNTSIQNSTGSSSRVIRQDKK